MVGSSSPILVPSPVSHAAPTRDLVSSAILVNIQVVKESRASVQGLQTGLDGLLARSKKQRWSMGLAARCVSTLSVIWARLTNSCEPVLGGFGQAARRASVCDNEFCDAMSLKHRLGKLHGFPACGRQILHRGAAPIDVQVVLSAVSDCCSDTAAKNRHLPNRCGDTALSRAAYQGHVEIVVELLLEAGAHTHMRDRRGSSTASGLTACKGYVEIARFLL